MAIGLKRCLAFFRRRRSSLLEVEFGGSERWIPPCAPRALRQWGKVSSPRGGFSISERSAMGATKIVKGVMSCMPGQLISTQISLVVSLAGGELGLECVASTLECVASPLECGFYWPHELWSVHKLITLRENPGVYTPEYIHPYLSSPMVLPNLPRLQNQKCSMLMTKTSSLMMLRIRLNLRYWKIRNLMLPLQNVKMASKSIHDEKD